MRFICLMTCVTYLYLTAGCSTAKKLMWWKDPEPQSEEVEQEEVQQEEDEPGAVGKMVDSIFGSESEDEEPKQKENQISVHDLDLRFARAFARIDELEREVTNHKAKIQVLQKAVMLGMVPEELLNQADEDYRKRYLNQSSTDKMPKNADPVAPPEKPSPQVMVAPATKADSAGGKESYEKLIANAQQNFRMGRYGVAVRDYSIIGRDYGQFDSNQNHRYWVALCWYHLKEFETARERFQSFISEVGSSPWIPRAKFYLAKVETELGLHDKALMRLKAVLTDHPHEDAADMARNEIKNLRERL